MITMALPELGASPMHTSTIVLVQQPGNGDNGGQGEDFGKSSPVGLLILILFLIAVAFLVRSMTKHLKRVPESFDKDDAGKGDGEESGPTDADPRKAREKP